MENHFILTMTYQLPNGKVIYVSIEDYLAMSDNEFNGLVQNSPGDEPSYKMHSLDSHDIEEEEVFCEPEYLINTDELEHKEPFNINTLPDELTL